MWIFYYFRLNPFWYARYMRCVCDILKLERWTAPALRSQPLRPELSCQFGTRVATTRNSHFRINMWASGLRWPLVLYEEFFACFSCHYKWLTICYFREAKCNFHLNLRVQITILRMFTCMGFLFFFLYLCLLLTANPKPNKYSHTQVHVPIDFDFE